MNFDCLFLFHVHCSFHIQCSFFVFQPGNREYLSFYVYQREWQPTKPKGPVFAQDKGPGPAVTSLPTTIGKNTLLNVNRIRILNFIQLKYSSIISTTTLLNCIKQCLSYWNMRPRSGKVPKYVIFYLQMQTLTIFKLFYWTWKN